MNKFKLGQLVWTRRINDEIADNEQFAKDVINALTRYKKCDWGDTCEDDKPLNDKAVENNDDRILASYNTCIGEIWIITEWNRGVTTVLFPDED
jgi:hypothetical protein